MGVPFWAPQLAAAAASRGAERRPGELARQGVGGGVAPEALCTESEAGVFLSVPKQKSLVCFHQSTITSNYASCIINASCITLCKTA
jgi:hypothetical protein